MGNDSGEDDNQGAMRRGEGIGQVTINVHHYLLLQLLHALFLHTHHSLSPLSLSPTPITLSLLSSPQVLDVLDALFLHTHCPYI